MRRVCGSGPAPASLGPAWLGPDSSLLVAAALCFGLVTGFSAAALPPAHLWALRASRHLFSPFRSLTPIPLAQVPSGFGNLILKSNSEFDSQACLGPSVPVTLVSFWVQGLRGALGRQGLRAKHSVRQDLCFAECLKGQAPSFPNTPWHCLSCFRGKERAGGQLGRK